ncbi:rhodanese-like/PpiC domain-containing protein 12, chloroplastic isoform X2 [Brassica napus]|uniref:rhodanese-like/PpiC domain-containing protein 12, chloroplastic isoform X2 n=1 Tax=Brassica napus TaxID=3708 RepID=UPI0006AB14E3|nr:rhodanese-like/PpiC domain-containing protein 12, chloroplastic isoform X2 [Brassica napus]
MFRVTGILSAASSPAAASFSAVLRLSIVPSLAIASPPHPRWFSTFSRSFLGGRKLQSRIPSPYPIRLSGFSDLKARASFSSGSNPTREILVQHVLLKEGDSALFAELQKRILDGEDMSDLAAEYSICPSKKDGGLLGWVKLGQMVPEFEEAAFKAELNHVVTCKTQFGWHLLQVLSEREPVKDIQVEELHSKMQDLVFMEEAQLVDVREPDEIAKASLPGFQVFPLRQFESWAPEITSKLNPDKDTFAMCKAGGRSLNVANWLLSQGFKSVYTVAGGIQAYSLKVDPSIPTY